MYTLLLVSNTSAVTSAWFCRTRDNINKILNENPGIPVYTKWPWGDRAFVVIRHHDTIPDITSVTVTRREIVE